MAIFIGSADPTTRRNARAAFGAPTMSPGLRRDVTRKLGLDEQATSEEIYQAAIKHLERMRAEGERRADKDARRIGGEIDEAVGRFPSSRSAALGASHAHVIGLALAREARRLVACGKAPDLAEAQRMAVRADPSILRR